MPRWSDLPSNHLLADVSLWSADLANLQTAVETMEPFADSFHLDVSDDRFAPGLLFFPDLVNALRPHTKKPLHTHLFVEKPSRLLEAFLAAGVNVFTIHVEIGDSEISTSFDALRNCRCELGLALRPETPVEAVEDLLTDVSLVLLLNTPLGTKGAPNLSPNALSRIREMDAFLKKLGVRDRVRIEADGAIRRHTVPLLRQAGADVVVPGSLAFAEPDPAEVFQWLRSL
jgi:ribulose-phosphate 3-epimerase